MYAAFPRSEYRMGESDFHHRFDLPQKVSYRLAYSAPYARRDSDGSPRFLMLPFPDVPCS